VCLCALVNANVQGRYYRVVQTPNCNPGVTSCQLTANDEVGNTQQQSNLTTVRLDASQSKLRAVFSYQPANRPGVDVRVISAQAEIVFAGVAEWIDSNSDNIPDASELSNQQNIAPVGGQTFQTGSLGTSLIPFTTALTVGVNFTAKCYIVANDSYYLPFDDFKLSGFGAGCRLEITKSASIAPTSRLALMLRVDTSLLGGVVSPGTLEDFTWGPLNGYQGRRLQSGGAYIIFGTKGQTAPFNTPSTDTVSVGAFTPTTGTEYAVPLGLVANGVDSFHFDVAFEPQQIAYQSSSSTLTVSMMAMLAVFCMLISFY